MKFMIHAPHPDMAKSGYASQVREIVPRLVKAGHEVAISCTAGVVLHNTTWQGVPVYGRSSYTDMAEDLIQWHYADFGADLVITLCCPWKLHGQVWKHMRTIHLMPIDRSPLGVLDYQLLSEGGGMPAAISRFGETQLRARGLDPLYLPHAVDTRLWHPPADRARLRKALAVEHLFVAGINASNTDPDDRKNFWESFSGFARFHEKHPKSILAVHAAPIAPDGLNLLAMAAHLGIGDVTMFSDSYQLAGAGAPQQALAAWYGSLDVLLNLGNEGFGVPGAEAQACGTPVINGSYGPLAELAGPGWLVDAVQPTWNNGHCAEWSTPSIAGIAAALAEAAGDAANRRHLAREFAVEHLDYDRVWAEHWAPVLAEL
jgi:glycosyltransferase involved in cell wall biosynthesis